VAEKSAFDREEEEDRQESLKESLKASIDLKESKGKISNAGNVPEEIKSSAMMRKQQTF
jgi:hypothetical protein